ncbi:MAG: xanthine dehydrogenase [Parvularcula sp.]|nr:xanthine dehydrogenase [Parvularcula sp.]
MRFDPSGGDVLSFALERMERGAQVAFATLIYIDGSSPRATGAQMAISEDGGHAGSISSGCLERAIIDEARQAMARGAGGVIRYGKGSPFVDVALPCGSGVDILFSVNPDRNALAAALKALEERKPVSLAFRAGDVSEKAKTPDAFTRHYEPAIRIVAAGFGPELTVLASLAHAAGFDFCALSPDDFALRDCASSQTIHLASSSQIQQISIDARSACVLLFHDREWERALAPRFLRSPAFYVGAVGGRKTAAARREMLIAEGLAPSEIDRLAAPIGLVPMTRDPAALAVSILAEIVAQSRAL